MKEGWEYKKLGEVCDIVGRIGFRGYKRTDYVDSESEGAISLSPSNIVDGELVYDKNTYISWEKYEESPEIMIFKGDVLLVKTASVGKNAIVKELPHKATINPQFVVFKNITINNKYLLFAIRSKYMQTKIRMITSGSSVPTLSQKALGELAIPVPPLSEQQSIVAELDKINEIIGLKKAQLKDLDLLAQSIFYEMFGDPIENPKGWEVKKFQNLFKLKSGDGLSAKAFIPGKYPVYGGNGISGYHNDFNKDGVYIIIGRVGALCGNVRMVEGQFWLTDNAFQLFYAEDNFDIVYLRNKLKLLNLRRFANAAAQPVISNSTLKDIDIILPPLPLQQSFAEKIQAIESQKSAIKQSLAEVETLLASRMDYWFG